MIAMVCSVQITSGFKCCGQHFLLSLHKLLAKENCKVTQDLKCVQCCVPCRSLQAGSSDPSVMDSEEDESMLEGRWEYLTSHNGQFGDL